MWYPGNSQLYVRPTSNEIPAAVAGGFVAVALNEQVLKYGLPEKRTDDLNTPWLMVRPYIDRLISVPPQYSMTVMDLAVRGE